MSEEEKECFKDLFTRPKPKKDDQPQSPTPAPATNAVGTSTEELLQKLELYIAGIQDVIRSIRENAPTEKENRTM